MSVVATIIVIIAMCKSYVPISEKLKGASLAEYSSQNKFQHLPSEIPPLDMYVTPTLPIA